MKKVLGYVSQQKNDKKEMNSFHFLRRSVNKNAGGTSRYIIKKGSNKGKTV